MNTETKTVLDLETMLDENLDAIPEAPDFSNPPPGEYTLLVKDALIDKYETKAEPGIQKQRLKILYAIEETLSIANNEPPAPNGTMFNENFQATTDGLSYFKKRIRSIMDAAEVNGVTLGDMMSSVKGEICKARISIRKTTGKDGTEYENLNIRIVPNK